VFHFDHTLAVALRDVVGEEVVTFAVPSAAVDFDVAPARRFAQVGQLREVFAAHHQQVELFHHLDSVDLLALHPFVLHSLISAQVHPIEVGLIAKDERSLFVEHEQGGREGGVNGIEFDKPFVGQVFHFADHHTIQQQKVHLFLIWREGDIEYFLGDIKRLLLDGFGRPNLHSFLFTPLPWIVDVDGRSLVLVFIVFDDDLL
jgi:hypothetical protein